jgi:wyosine [tRNA(Phe)-imidazoG37] synthetase (radical SAM superfamily)
MLVNGVNDSEANAAHVADFLTALEPDVSYVSIPTRPPAEKNVHIPSEHAINRFYQILSEKVEDVEHLIGYEGNTFAFTGNVKDDLLSITAVHPMRQDGVEEFLQKADATWEVVDELLAAGMLKASEYESKTYFIRSLPSRHTEK